MRRFLLPWARRAGDATLMARALVRRDRDFTMPPLVGRPLEPLLVIAPHADDESIGCGGTLALAEDAAVLVLTGDARRRDEATAAAGVLGVEVEFLDLPDNRIPSDGKAAVEVREVIARRRPRSVLVPYPLDRHGDHARAARLLAGVLTPDVEIWCYEVWSPLDPNRLVDITSAVDTKRAAIECHSSQTRELDYTDAAIGLNRYRALLAPGATYAEAFLACSLDELRTLGGT
jgi:LmbE family N-acetylglucosaminyl deacetylase